MRFSCLFKSTNQLRSKLYLWNCSQYNTLSAFRCDVVSTNGATDILTKPLNNKVQLLSTNALLTPAFTALQYQTRNHWRERRSKHAPYTKPLNFDFSGDLDMSMGDVDLKSSKVRYEDIPELNDASEEVKKLFSLEFGPYSSIMEKRMSELMRQVRDHPLDIQSVEVKIAKLTLHIRRNIEHCLRFRHDKLAKQKLIKMINIRKCCLRQLQMDDIDKFNWITKELNLKLVEKPEGFKWPSKAEKRKEAATQAAVAAARVKTEKLKKALEEQRVAFEQYKEQELADIESGLRSLGLKDEDLGSLEATLTALDRAHMIPRAVPVEPREQMLQRRLLEKNMPIKKKTDDELLRLHGFYTSEEFKYYPDHVSGGSEGSKEGGES